MKLKTYVTIAICAGLVAGVYALHRSSYCFAENRFVSDREMITTAINDEIDRINAKPFNRLPDDPGETNLPIMSSYHFEQLNPGCCRILNGEEESKALHLYSLLDGIFGYWAVVVGINYKIRYLDAQGVQHERPAYSNVPVSSCGTIAVEVYR